MDERTLYRINKYKEAGWRIDRDEDNDSILGLHLISPRGNAFTFREIYENKGLPPWDVWKKDEIKESRSFGKFYRLIDEIYGCCHPSINGILKLFENN